MFELVLRCNYAGLSLNLGWDQRKDDIFFPRGGKLKYKPPNKVFCGYID